MLCITSLSLLLRLKTTVFTPKLERLRGLEDIYSTLLRYYPETLFLDDVDKKMKQVRKEISTLEQPTTTAK